MIDLDVIEAEVDNSIRHYSGVALMQCSYVKELVARLRQAEKDAARYRWLDGQNKSVMSKVMVCNGWIDDSEDDVEYISDLSSFIDEAMKCTE